MSKLFEGVKIGSLNLRNRIVIAPMCQYSAVDGKATDWHLMHLGSLSHSGAGLLILEATAVEANGRITPFDLGLYSNDNQMALEKVIYAIRQHSKIPIGVQLAHAGRKASCAAPWKGGKILEENNGGWMTDAPSAIPFNNDERLPHALNKNELERIKQSFLKSAERAITVGLDLIELHAAHGYLLHQFLSPLSNTRTDEYGGSLENRMRYPLELFKFVRTHIKKDIPIGIRISASDWVEGGWNIDESIQFAIELQTINCAFIHVSSGGLSPLQKIPVEAGYQVHFADRIKKKVSMPVIAVGLITEAQQAETILKNNQADLIAIARAALYDPRWPWHAAAELKASVDVPPQYLRSEPREFKDLFKK
jgi:2,4-dienoyl-CoA reductase-like NADH-dependent reductase (Old Yellow Enzyme family)